MVGIKAVEAANKGETGVMVIINRKNTKKYSITTSTYDIHNIANVEKKIPFEWINKKDNQMNDAFLDYARPLIEGELLPIFKNGLPSHLVRK